MGFVHFMFACPGIKVWDLCIRLLDFPSTTGLSSHRFVEAPTGNGRKFFQAGSPDCGLRPKGFAIISIPEVSSIGFRLCRHRSSGPNWKWSQILSYRVPRHRMKAFATISNDLEWPAWVSCCAGIATEVPIGNGRKCFHKVSPEPV